MALPDKRDELSRVEDRDRLEVRNQRTREEERRAHGHDFAMDIHPERYPRESLSRIEEGIFDDDQLRHADDRLSATLPDMEARVDNARNLSRLLVVLGACLLGFAWVLLLWVGWDVRSGSIFFSTMCVIATVIGFGLITWGYVERRRVVRLLSRMPMVVNRESIERFRTERELREGDTAA